MKLTLGLSAMLVVLAGAQSLRADPAEQPVAIVTERHVVTIVRPTPRQIDGQQIARALIAHTEAVRAAERRPTSRRARFKLEDASDVLDALLELYEIEREEPEY